MHRTLAFLMPLTLVACTLAEEDDGTYDAALLQEYKAALPTSERLQSGVPTPAATPGALALATDSEIAAFAIEAAVAVNEPAAAIVTTLEAITAVPPTLYDSEKREFLWGPWDAEDGAGKVLAYIVENEPGADFQYGYAFARLMGEDLATAVPIIAGGATPDPAEPERGVGVTLWDLGADAAFDQEHDPAYDANAPRSLGRVVMVYGAGNDGAADYFFNVAVLRDFVDEEAEPGTAPVDSELFYGRSEPTTGDALHFMDWAIEGDLCDAAPDSCFENATVADLPETFAFRAAFAGIAGRGEATVSGGDLAAPVSLAECWDGFMATTYYSVTDGTQTFTEGSCGGAEATSLADSGVPLLTDIDPELMAALDCVASNGIDACD